MSDEWKTCSAEGCAKKARTKGATYCETHYYRLRRNGTTAQLRPWSRHKGMCKVDDCVSPVDAEQGMCQLHATRVARHGDPLAFTHQRDRNYSRGEDHEWWTGSDATYTAVHQRVKASRGPASGHPCTDCGGKAEQWSYDHGDPDERFSEDGRAYSLDASHYFPRCVSCHKRYDYAVLRRKGRLGTAPRCAKPMKAKRDPRRVSMVGSAPVCGRPEGHNGPCRSVESYTHHLEVNRGAA
jgi:hypothetical protein